MIKASNVGVVCSTFNDPLCFGLIFFPSVKLMLFEALMSCWSSLARLGTLAFKKSTGKEVCKLADQQKCMGRISLRNCGRYIRYKRDES